VIGLREAADVRRRVRVGPLEVRHHPVADRTLQHRVGRVPPFEHVAENLGVRQIRFEPGGSVTDLGMFALGNDAENIVGSIRVQP
jgi:hypothetical protein